MSPSDLPIFRDPEARAVLEEVCKRHGITAALLSNLLEVQRTYAGAGRQIGITAEFSNCISEFLDEGDQETS